jgi:predicted nucleic acid-binding protein
MNVFIDTSAFYAVISSTDAHHADAVARWQACLDDSETRLYTSNYIVVETCALLRNRLGMTAAQRFVREMLPATAILWVDDATHFAATEAMLMGGTHAPSLVDCTSFALMHEHGILHALAYDAHFTAIGISTN